MLSKTTQRRRYCMSKVPHFVNMAAEEVEVAVEVTTEGEDVVEDGMQSNLPPLR